MDNAAVREAAEALERLGGRLGLGMTPMAVATALVVLSLTLGGCSQKTGGTGARPSNQAQFDVPSLVGKNIDQVRTILGSPANGKSIKQPLEPTKQLVSLGTTEWDNLFKKDGEELLVTYDVASRRVMDFFLSDDSPDRDRLVRVGNLNPNSTNYRIEYVQNLADPSQITGVKVIPSK